MVHLCTIIFLSEINSVYKLCMDYKSHVLYTYENVGSPDFNCTYCIGYKGNFTMYNYGNDYNTLDYQTYLGRCVAKFRDSYGYDDNIAALLTYNDEGVFLSVPTETDFLIIEKTGSGSLTLADYSFDADVNDTYNYLDDLYQSLDQGVNGGYYLGAGNGADLPTNLYGNYDTTLSVGDAVVWDLSNYKNSIYNQTDRQLWSVMYNRADQRGYYTMQLKLTGSEPFNLSIGSVYDDIYNTGFANGFSNGYIKGSTDYSGQMAQTGNPTPTAFTYIGNAFSAVGGIMSIEVLPNITLGLCFSIPLVLVLIMTIFRLVKK